MNKQQLKRNNEANSDNSKVAFLFVFAVLLIGGSGVLAPTFDAGEINPQNRELSSKEGAVLTPNRQTGRYLKMPSQF